MATKKSAGKSKKKPAKGKAQGKKKSTAKKKKMVQKKKTVLKKKPKSTPKKKAASKKKASPTKKKTAKKSSPKKAGRVKKPSKAKKAAVAAEKSGLESAADVRFGLDSKVQRQANVAWRMIDGEAVIITPADSTMHTLNDVGTRIWELITGSRSLREVAELLCAEFEVDRQRAEKDTLWFAECLAKKGLVEFS